MASYDPRVDAYIARSADFAKPVLEYVRALVHEACPEVEETIKWGMPTFICAGGILCGMAAFKQHASFGFWKHAMVIGDGSTTEGMGSIGKLVSVADLPTKRQLLVYLKKAVRLNDQGIKASAVRKVATPKPLPEIPADFAAALSSNAAASTTFEHFATSHRREYLEWILGAKRMETRARRISQAIEWLAEGKSRNWKYENC
jgi:hypothetical protein